MFAVQKKKTPVLGPGFYSDFYIFSLCLCSPGVAIGEAGCLPSRDGQAIHGSQKILNNHISRQ